MRQTVHVLFCLSSELMMIKTPRKLKKIFAITSENDHKWWRGNTQSQKWTKFWDRTKKRLKTNNLNDKYVYVVNLRDLYPTAWSVFHCMWLLLCKVVYNRTYYFHCKPLFLGNLHINYRVVQIQSGPWLLKVYKRCHHTPVRNFGKSG